MSDQDRTAKKSEPRPSATVVVVRDATRAEPGLEFLLLQRGEIQLAPPTFVTVQWLSEHTRAEHAQDVLGREPIITFRPRLHRGATGACMLYPGDAGYETGDPDQPGPRHRIWALANGWRYERSG